MKTRVRVCGRPSGRIRLLSIAAITLAVSIFCTTATRAQFTVDNQTITISAVTSNWVGNGTYVVGSNFVNDALIIQNGGVLNDGTGYIGFEPNGAANDSALITGNNSSWNNGGDLAIGTNSSVGDTLTVTNNGGVLVGGTLNVIRGQFSIYGGKATVGQLTVVGGSQAQFAFSAGTLNTSGTAETNGSFFVVGDGVNAATMNLLGGTHSFGDALCISSNAVLTGSGVVNGIISNVNATGTGGQIIANGTTLTFLSPVGVSFISITNPAIATVVITNGGALVFSGLDPSLNAWNLAANVLNGGGATGGSIISSNSGTGRSLILRHPSLRSNNGTLAVVGGAGINYTLIGAPLTNTYVITGEGSFTGNFGGSNFGILNQGTVTVPAGKLLTFDPRDSATLAGFQNDTIATVNIANGGTFSIRRTTNAWWRAITLVGTAQRYNTNSGTIFMQNSTLRGDTDQGAAPTNITVAGLFYNGSSGLIHGCGTIANFNSFINNGTIQADCGTFTMNLVSVALTFTNGSPVVSPVFTNNGTWKATSGSVLESTALVVNNGTIDITAGTTNFLGGFVNNGTVVTGGCGNSRAAIKLVQKVGSDVQLSFTTPCTVVYTVETNGNLVTGTFTTLTTTNGNGTNGVITITDTGAATQPLRFYRVRSP